MNRKNFLRISLAVVSGGLVLSPTRLFSQQPVKPPQIAPETVREFIAKSHTDLDRVREMLGAEPNLLNAAWDLGGGDFETGIGAASHVGRKDIVQFFLDHGARADIFTYTMLGETALVQALLEKFPALLNAPGPHGLTLLHHAEKGGENAAPLVEFLTSKGLTERKLDLYKKIIKRDPTARRNK